jgi:hypothetical protein
MLDVPQLKINNMKDLITVFAYCPDNHRKKILQELLIQLQPIRDKFEIMVVAHSPISELSYDLIDHFYYDSSNKLLTDFDVRKKHWYTNDIFDINSTLVYPASTHLAIYSLLYYTFNFAKFRGFNKVHCIEYDINLTDLNLFDDVSSTLDDYDTVMFKREKDGWLYGTYFAFTMNDFPEEYFVYDEEKILNQLRNTETKMTESITDKLLTPNGRTIKLEPLFKLDPTNVFQKVDNHMNDELMWCVPLCDRYSDMVYFFVFNSKGGEYDIDIIVNDKHLNINTNCLSCWYKRFLGDINEINEILVLVNKKIKKHIILNDENREMFRKYNFIEDRV